MFSRIDVQESDTCWLWTGAKNDAGYGQLRVRGENIYAHRAAYELDVGPLGSAFFCHTCDTPACCNPKHAFLGTQADNLADMRKKGRWVIAPARGAAVYGTKLTEDDVREVRRAVASGAGIRPTARRFGVSQGAVQGVIRGRTWKHVD